MARASGVRPVRVGTSSLAKMAFRLPPYLATPTCGTSGVGLLGDGRIFGGPRARAGPVLLLTHPPPPSPPPTPRGRGDPRSRVRSSPGHTKLALPGK